MKKYLKASYGVTGSVTIKNDGTAKLIVKDCHGKTIHNKEHKNERSAMSAWYRLNA